MASPTETNGNGVLEGSNSNTPAANDSRPSAPAWSHHTVLDQIPEHSRPTPNTASPVPFFHLLQRLKTTKREGWRRFGIAAGESIADHMYRMSIITMLAPQSLTARLDVGRCTRMALVHDMAESLVGDITPVDNVDKAEKRRREGATMDYICTQLLGGVDGGDAGRELRAVFEEYEEGRSPEALFVKDVDKMELVLQMVEYERERGGALDLEEFSWVAGHIKLPEVQAWCAEVLGERERFWAGLGVAPKAAPGPGSGGAARRAQQTEYYGDGTASEGKTA